MKEDTNFVFAGNIGEAQSVETIIKAANEINDEEIKIHIVGEGSSLEKCKEMAKSMSLKNVEFYGKKSIDEMKSFYELADAMLITLKRDEVINLTLPGKVQSYMAASKPIIGAIDRRNKNSYRRSRMWILCRNRRLYWTSKENIAI